MSWTNEMITQFQIDNNKMLAQINTSLKPDDKPTNGKIGIFLPGQNGDLITAMSVLRYRDILWHEKEIIWFCNMPNADALRYSCVSEVRPWLWAGNGLPEGTPDFYPLLCNENNRLNKELAKQYDLAADLDDGYFPAPHQLTIQKRHRIDYPNCSKKVFEIDPTYKWNPILSHSKEEIANADKFISELPQKKNIMIETKCGSGQSIWDIEMTKETMRLCGDYNFILASELNQFTVRQVALLINYCDLFIGISSGISVATSAWGLKPVPKIQFCGSHICSTVSLASGSIELITHDDKNPVSAKQEFYHKLTEILKTI